ncbi:MAG: MFS transporter [Actinomycetota bacterium]|nr:MFS transporter [Actinomycetota bacterium]
MPRWLADRPALPLLVLTGLNLVDEFDRYAFSALTPEIRDTFGLSDAGIGAIGTISSVIIVFLAVPIGVAADRFSRIRLSALAAALWGVTAVATGIVTTVWALATMRFLSGIGRGANEIVHPSVLTDLYPSNTHPRVFQIHRMANPAAGVSALLAGWIAVQWSWEAAFWVLATPTAVLALLLLRVPEPPRSEPSGVAVETTERAGLREAFGRLAAIPALRRFWVTAFVLGATIVPAIQLVSLFFEQVHDTGPFGRGVVQFVLGAGWVSGLAIGGAVAGRRIANERYEELALICAAGFLLVTVGGLVMAASPAQLLSGVGAFVLAAGNGVYQPSYYTAVGRLAPGALSAQAYGCSVVIFGLGGTAAIPLFSVGDAYGYRTTMVIVALLGLGAAASARWAGAAMRESLEAVAAAGAGHGGPARGGALEDAAREDAAAEHPDA